MGVTAIALTAVTVSCALLQPKPLATSVQDRILLHEAKDTILAADYSVSMVGDIMLGGTAKEIYQKNGYRYAFDQTRHLLHKSSIAFGNLEGPLAVWGLTDPKKTYSFRSHPKKSADALAFAGFDVLALANNHALDYGVAGMLQTMDALDKQKIKHVGGGLDLNEARQAKYVNVDGKKVAFLSYSLTFPEEFWATETHPGVAFGHKEHVIEDVQNAKRYADAVLVSIHWGRESTTKLRPYQENIGRAAIDAGASIVIGHHPHILQAVEQYKHGVILYSLGNFAFGSYSKRVHSSVVAQAHFKGSDLVKLRFWPIFVRNNDVLFQSKIFDEEQANEVVSHLQTLSAERGTQLINDAGTALLILEKNS